MMTEDLSGDCLNIPAWWRFLHRPLFQSPSTSHSAVHLFSKQGRVLTCGVWVLCEEENRTGREGTPDPPQLPKPYLLCFQTWFLWCCCLSWAQMGALVWSYAHTKPSLHSQHCPVPLLTQRGRAPSHQDMGSLTCLLQRQQILTSLCGRELYLFILNEYIHPGK